MYAIILDKAVMLWKLYVLKQRTNVKQKDKSSMVQK